MEESTTGGEEQREDKATPAWPEDLIQIREMKE